MFGWIFWLINDEIRLFKKMQWFQIIDDNYNPMQTIIVSSNYS